MSEPEKGRCERVLVYSCAELSSCVHELLELTTPLSKLVDGVVIAYKHDNTDQDKIRGEGVDLCQMAPNEEAKYVHIFQRLSREDGYLNAKEGKLLLGESGLAEESLTRVWALLADSDCDGRLSLKVRT